MNSVSNTSNMPALDDDIRQLFRSDASAPTEGRELAVVTRHGQPILYLPYSRRQAMHTLSLYSPQRTRARLAHRLWRLTCSLGFMRLFASTTLSTTTASPLGGFLLSQINRQHRGMSKRAASREPALQSERLPAFGVFAGNPDTAGRRFILLVFDDDDRPYFVVKAGTTPQALRLLEQETSVLDKPPAGALGLPRLHGVHRSPHLQALALDYISGKAPTRQTSGELARVLGSWIDASRTVTGREVAAWQRLVAAADTHPVLKALRPAVDTSVFHPVLYHGDYTPWNIKITPDGSWVILDWERGERLGMPCWDWFHYRIQVSLLVDRIPAAEHATSLERWLKEQEFRDYAARVGVSQIVRELVLAYLINGLEVIRPSSGLQAMRDLLNVLTQRWNTG